MKIRTKLELAVFVPILMASVIIVVLVLSYQESGRVQDTGDAVRQIRSSITELNHHVISYILYDEERPKQQSCLSMIRLQGYLPEYRYKIRSSNTFWTMSAKILQR
jgi:hypothetical protein